MSTLSIPNTFAPGQVIASTLLNGNFTAISTWAGGNITDSNFGTMAGVVTWNISSSDLALDITSTSVNGAVDIDSNGVLSASKNIVRIASTAAQTTGTAGLLIDFTSGSSSIPLVRAKNAGSGASYESYNTSGAHFKAHDGTNTDAVLDASGVWTMAGARVPGFTNNLGLGSATTSEAADSILIRGATDNLSASNRLHVTVPSTTAGLLTALNAQANVTIDLTGAHWGYGTKGDRTGSLLFVYAINDGGTLKWGVSAQRGLRSIASANSSATPTDITEKRDMLVSTALDSGTWPCVEVGWVTASFDDTGGAAEDLWAVSTVGVGRYVQERVFARARLTGSDQTISGTPEVVIFGTEDEDDHGAYDSSTGVFTAPVQADYVVNAQVALRAFSNADEFDVMVYKNGAEYSRTRLAWPTADASVSCLSIKSIVPCDADDTLAIYAVVSAGNDKDIDGTNNAYWSFLEIYAAS